MEKSLKRYKYSLIICIVIILLLLFRMFMTSEQQSGALNNSQENAIEGVLGSITFNKDGNLALFNNQGEPLKPVELPLKLRGGELKLMTNISMFGVKGSPMRIVIHMGNSTYAFCVDYETGKLLPYSDCE